MDVLILLLFVGLVLVGATATFFVWTVRSGALQHSDRLALLPLREDHVQPADAGTDFDKRTSQPKEGFDS